MENNSPSHSKSAITGINAFYPGNLKTGYLLKKANFENAIQNKENFRQYLRTPGAGPNSLGSWSWKNEDLLPTPIEVRNWTWLNYFYFYFSLSMDNWTLGSVMVGIGLNWWQSILVIFGSQCISAIAMAINSREGEVYHIGYPVVCRSVFGLYGAYYTVFARAVLAVVYYAIKLYIGSSFVVNMLTALFGKSYSDIPNHIPASAGFTTKQMLAFFLYWLVHVPFTLFRPHQLRWLFKLKMCTVVPACFGLFIFCMVNTRARIEGGLPSSGSTSTSPSGWFFMYAINSGIGNISNLITNQPDFSRWAKYRYASVWSQIFASTTSVTISATLGILATSAINNAWGLQLWNPWDLLSAIMERYPRPAVRFAVFICATFWALLVLGTNVAANMIPFGADSSMLLPRYINIPRGQFLGLTLAWVVCPWKILASAQSFTNFLGGYIIFMAAATGVMVADYYVITRGNVFIQHLYDGKMSNPHYYYHRGWNIQAYIAYVCGAAIPFPGFCGSLGANVSVTATNLGHIGWCLSFIVAFVVYVAICCVWPTQNQRAMKGMNLKWEAMADEILEGLEVHSTADAFDLGSEEKNVELGGKN